MTTRTQLYLADLRNDVQRIVRHLDRLIGAMDDEPTGDKRAQQLADARQEMLSSFPRTSAWNAVHRQVFQITGVWPTKQNIAQWGSVALALIMGDKPKRDV